MKKTCGLVWILCSWFLGQLPLLMKIESQLISCQLQWTPLQVAMYNVHACAPQWACMRRTANWCNCNLKTALVTLHDMTIWPMKWATLQLTTGR